MAYEKTHPHLSFKFSFQYIYENQAWAHTQRIMTKTLDLYFSWFSLLRVKICLWQIHNRNPASVPSHKYMGLGCLCHVGRNTSQNLARAGSWLPSKCDSLFNFNPHSDVPLLSCVDWHSEGKPGHDAFSAMPSQQPSTLCCSQPLLEK